jgi:hypothetical protein
MFAVTNDADIQLLAGGRMLNDSVYLGNRSNATATYSPYGIALLDLNLSEWTVGGNALHDDAATTQKVDHTPQNARST